VIAALLLLARTYLRRYGLPHPSATEILEATQTTRSRAYELSGRLLTMLGELVQPLGRPATPTAPPAPDASATLSRRVLRLLREHPGAVGPRFYAEVFRKKILELREAHAKLDLDTFGKAVGVPPGTLEDWLRAGRSLAETPERTPDEDPTGSVRIQSILAAWRSWRGPFTAFCDHVRHHLRIEYGRTLIARILHTHGERHPARRTGRTSDERASRDSFAIYFPGAQWVGDGMQVPVEINGLRFDFNLELDVDAASGAIVGASVRDEEDGEAVVAALTDGIATTSAAPIALLLDNRPSNHTEEVQAALGATIGIRSTPGRGQSKAHVEGAFGLFSQHAPPLTVHAETLHDLAREILRLRVQTWARTLNHRPRADRDGKSRFELYDESKPTPEQIAQARRELEDLRRKQEKAAATRRARVDPVVRGLLDAAFERLGLVDPDSHLRCAIATFTLDAVVDGLAIFDGKKHTGTLPDAADARYLLGIVRNLEHQHESNAITEALIRERLALRDAMLTTLERERDEILRNGLGAASELRAFVDRAMSAHRMIDRHFWLSTAGDQIATRTREEQIDLFRAAARRIHATFGVPRPERAAAERILARRLWPVR
jgi:hypothetical protein